MSRRTGALAGLLLALLVASPLAAVEPEGGPVAEVAGDLAAAGSSAWSCLGETLRLIFDGATAVAVVYGVWLAKRGVDTWREELVGSKHHEAALAVLRNVLRVQHALPSVRTSLILNSDHSPDWKPGDKTTAKEREYIYDKRCREFSPLCREVRIAVCEVQALVGSKFASDIVDRFTRFINKLFFDIIAYIDYMKLKEEGQNVDAKKFEKKERVAVREYAQDGGGDETERELDEIVKEFERILRPLVRGEAVPESKS